MQKSKQLGQVYTPKWIVDEILDSLGYRGHHILRKRILEPSCGEGAFLVEIVRRYIQAAKLAGLSELDIVDELGTYIYGVEIDGNAYLTCLDNLNQLIQQELGNEYHVEWHIFHQDTLLFYTQYTQFFHYIVGNPPYIRVHNLDIQNREFIKKHFNFTKGTTDIYLAFFEMAFKMLIIDGKIGFITPNSFLYNSSYKAFRQYLKSEKTVKEIIDFQSYKVFDGFSTYTAITLFDFSTKNEKFRYKEFNGNQIEFIDDISISDLDDNKWVLSNQTDKAFLDEVVSCSTNLEQYFNIQYGFATLRDRIFIGKITEFDQDYVIFNQYKIEKSILSKIVKGSKFRGDSNDIEWIIFPYKKEDGRYVAYSENELKIKFPFAYSYLLNHKTELLKRDLDQNSEWFVFGRSQGIQNSNSEKIVLSPLVYDKVHFHTLPADVFVYSGIFITKRETSSSWDIINTILGSDRFYRYIRLTGKDFSGGYKSISTKQIKQFNIASYQENPKISNNIQLSLFESENE